MENEIQNERPYVAALNGGSGWLEKNAQEFNELKERLLSVYPNAIIQYQPEQYEVVLFANGTNGQRTSARTHLSLEQFAEYVDGLPAPRGVERF